MSVLRQHLNEREEELFADLIAHIERAKLDHRDSDRRGLCEIAIRDVRVANNWDTDAIARTLAGNWQVSR